jgi:AcrR family transcriptional regulator
VKRVRLGLPDDHAYSKLGSIMKKTRGKSKNGSRVRRAAPDMRVQALAAARRLIVDRPDEVLTMRAVAEATGVTHPNLSHHFGSLAGLHATLAEELIRELFAGLRTVGLDVNNNEDYEVLVDRVFELFDKKGLGRVVEWLVRSGETARLKPVNDLLAQFIAELAHGHTENEARVIARDALVLTFAAYSESWVGPLLGNILKISAAQRRRYFVQALTALNTMY